MESVLGRYRNLVILVGVLFLQILGLAVQVKRSNDTENTRLIRVWAVDMVTPFERVLIWAQNGTGNLWRNYVYLRGVRAENRQLKDQIEQLRLEQVRLNEDAVQAHRLQALLGFKEQYISRTVAAQVIGSSGSDSSRMLYIDKGEDQGLKRDMAVITADGIVGKVLQVFPSVSQVLLINDQTSGVGTILEKSRLQGFLKGTATGEVVLEGVMSDEQVAPGERVLTSGGDQIFPKGLPVGTVTKVATGKDLFLNIRIKPSVNLSTLEEVLVVAETKERQAVTADVGRVRAADILAQRLPSVPDKPAIVTSATTVPTGSVAPPKPVLPKPVAPTPVPAGGETISKPVKSLSGSAVAASQPAPSTVAPPKKSAAAAQTDPAHVDPTQVDPAQANQAQPEPAKVAPAQAVPAPAGQPNSQDSPH
jgi:rod shape-determining protein MreC